LFNCEVGRTNKIWEFFAALVVNIDLQEKRILLSELREIIFATPMNPVLNLFLHLSGVQEIEFL